LDRTRPHHIEIVFDLAFNSSVTLSLKFDNAFLKWNEFPPDAQHGHSLNSALVSYKKTHSVDDQFRSFYNTTSIYEALSKKESKSSSRLLKIYTEILLIDLPVPDFSMPYNVICLACTVVAIAFGSLHNFTTRKFIFSERKSKFDRIFAKIKGLIR
jgi:GPI-anchor transamidase subunit T